MDNAAVRPSKILSAVGALIESLLGTVQKRIQLLSTELQEEKLRLVQLFIWIAAIVFAGMMTVAFASFTVVYIFWENARVAALGGATLFYGVGLAVVYWQFRLYLARQPKPFDATLSELEKDRACIPPTS